MSMNGAEIGVDANGTTPRTENRAHLPMEVEVTPAGKPDARKPGVALGEVARRVPAAGDARAPLVGPATPPAFKEPYRELRHAVEQMQEKMAVRTIAVCSPCDGDGKSVTAANLALTLSEGGARRVVLVDADFRNPKVAEILEAEAPIGLAEVLAGKASLEKAMFAADPKGLYGLSAGNLEATGLDPLDVAERFATLMNRLATVFDFVVVDTPSLDRHVDAAAYATRLDGALMVVRAGKTKASRLDEAIAKLGENRMLGLILNRA